MSRTAYDSYELAQGWEEAAFGVFTPEEAAYFAAELAGAGAMPRQAMRVLDIGFGNGTFMGWCRSRGMDCQGLEVNPRLVQRAAQHGFVSAQDVPALVAATAGVRYDLITGFDVLEHIERGSLVSFLSQLRELCTSQTLLLFRFPNGDNPFALPLQNGDVTHVNAIGQSMVRQICKLAEFEIVAVRSPARQAEAATLTRRIKLGVGLPLRWTIGQLFRHLFMGGAQVVFSANLLAVLRCETSR